MKLAIVGYGRMGKEVEQQAQQRGHEICSILDVGDSLTASALNGAEVLISFILADAVLPNLQKAAKLGISVVEGTTGWYDKLAKAKELSNLTMIYSPNFSIGVYLFSKIVGTAARLIGPLSEYDCYVHEFHHKGKNDSPSGTAKKLADILLEHLPQKGTSLYDTSHGVIDQSMLHVTSTRVGRVPGIHEIGFDSSADEITLKHTAHGREGFALGAVRAAEWIIGKSGIFTMDDFMSSLLGATGNESESFEK